MKAFNKDAMNLFAHLPDNKLYFINQSMENISDLYRTESQSAKDKAFEELESLRRKVPQIDYDKELESYREEKFGPVNLD